MEQGLKKTARTQVGIASLLMLATLPGRTQGLGLVTEPLLADLKLDRVTYAGMNLWATVLGALACFPAGWAIDRAGLRPSTAITVLLLAAAVWGLSAAPASVALMFLLLLATRAFGQSALSLCSIVTVGRWFPGGAGRAMAVYSVLLSVWFAMAFGAIGWSVRANGWRAAWLQVALGLLLVILPMVWLGLREPKRVAPGNSSSAAGTGSGLTLPEALRTPAFWLFGGTAAAFNFVSSGLGLFNESVLAERGFDRAAFHLFLVVSTLASLAGQFGSGWLTRRWRHQAITFAALIVYAAGLGVLPWIAQAWHMWALAMAMGISGGMIIVVFFSVWSDLFGQKQLGRIQGAAQMLTVLSSGLGPLVFAKCAEQYGSYAPLLLVLAGAVVVLALAVRMVHDPAVRLQPRET
jgi:MFS family permease